MYQIEEGIDLNGNKRYWILEGANLVHSTPTIEEAQAWIQAQP
jgi:hypothetical protein